MTRGERQALWQLRCAMNRTHSLLGTDGARLLSRLQAHILITAERSEGAAGRKLQATGWSGRHFHGRGEIRRMRVVRLGSPIVRIFDPSPVSAESVAVRASPSRLSREGCRASRTCPSGSRRPSPVARLPTRSVATVSRLRCGRLRGHRWPRWAVTRGENGDRFRTQPLPDRLF